MARREFTRGVKLKAWDRCERDGQHWCECGCGLPIFAADGVEYDHRVPCEMGGDASLSNCVVMRRACHKMKTVTQDVPAIKKGRSVRAKRAGAAGPKRALPGGKRSPWKAKIGGGWVRRDDD